MKKAVIVGCDGQDGILLSQYLSERGYSTIGLDKGTVKFSDQGWDEPVDITDRDNVCSMIRSSAPDEIYFLAAFHHSSEDLVSDEAELLDKSYQINVFAFLNFLEAVRKHSSGSKVFYAASSLIFEDTVTPVQNELTPFAPASPYAITKLDGLYLCRYYRHKYGLFAATGILYTHESRHRRNSFIAKKIIEAARNIKMKNQEKLLVGNLEAKNDWGYAPDFVIAMHKILQVEKADEFVVATGEEHSVADFVKIAFLEFGLDWRHYVVEDKNVLHRHRRTLVGDYRKLNEATGWAPTVTFEEMVSLLATFAD